MYLGIDLGTSAVKALLVDDEQQIVGEASAPLAVSRPQPLWSEQDPADWWRATVAVIEQLRAVHGSDLAAVRGLGLSGQMHGATLLDASDRVLRPAILWNDGRSANECTELECRAPRSREITGNLAMPGFTAPKLLWVARNEPEIFRRIARVLLPKDYVRLRLSGEHVSEMSDAAGTLWLDVGRRAWSTEMLAATGLPETAMPRLVEGSEPSARLRPALAREWGMRPDVVIAGGGGDNAAGAAGVGVVRPGEAFLSLGTSGVYFVSGDRFAPNPSGAVHAFCHCIPNTWHQMSVMLSAASCVSWIAAVTGGADPARVMESEVGDRDPRVIFLPYLSGERTPHNDPHAKGVFFGMTHETDRLDLVRAVLEGVAFAFADGQDALLATGTSIRTVSVIGGGARSSLWGTILASVLDRPLQYHAGGEVGPAFGAARLGRLALRGEDPLTVCTPPPVWRVVEPVPALRARYGERRKAFRQLYRDLKERFADLDP